MQERSSKIYGKTYRKTRVQEPVSKNVLVCRHATLFEKTLMEKKISVTFLKRFRTAFFFLQYTRESLPLISLAYLENLTVNEDLLKVNRSIYID